MTKTILVVGGALAGPVAAARARELDDHARIVMIERAPRANYEACGLAYHLSGEAGVGRQAPDLHHVELWTRCEVLAVDPEAQTVTLSDRAPVRYDALIFAAGAASVVPEEVPASSNVTAFRTLDDLARIEQSHGRVAVIGGGPFGLEAADGLTRRGAQVTVIEAGPRLLRKFGAVFGADARQTLAQRADVRTNTRVVRADVDGDRITRLHLSDGSSIDVDLVVVAAGIRPRTELLARAGAATAADGTLLIDASARTSLPNVFACGVCVSVPQAISGEPVWLPQGALADKVAQVAGANAAGGDFRLAPATGAMLVRLGARTYGRCGLAEGRRTRIWAPAIEPYMRDSTRMLVDLLWDERDGRILGVEIAGEQGVDKRVDVVAAAISGGLTIEQLAMLDLGYEPPFNATRDPLNVAATVASHELRGLGRSLFELPENAQVIDVAGAEPSMPGALSIPLDSLRDRLGELDRARPVVAMSRRGRRAWLAARILRQHGFDDAAHYAGGLDAWQLLH